MTQAILPAPRGLIGQASRTNKLNQSMTATSKRLASQMESQRMTAGLRTRVGIEDKMSITDYIQ